ncbi:hypothetical protein GCM10023310_00860 [Paenibacillus vulneris]|uniref:Phage head-tail connector protein n=1 Tax=Paenibacillus vulneris TaxID=1133364 RepID=A0ABW3V0R4_9BACL
MMTNDLYDPYLIKLKSLLGIGPGDISKDDRLLFAIETVVQGVMSYCNITEIPPALVNTVVLIAKDYDKSQNPEETSQMVQSVKRGDVQTTFFNSGSGGPGASFVQAYSKQLNAFRKLRW